MSSTFISEFRSRISSLANNIATGLLRLLRVSLTKQIEAVCKATAMRSRSRNVLECIEPKIWVIPDAGAQNGAQMIVKVPTPLQMHHALAKVFGVEYCAPSLKNMYLLLKDSTIATTTPECSTKRRVLVRQIQNVLRQLGCLDDTANLDCAFVFDELADGEEEVGRELRTCQVNQTPEVSLFGIQLTSEYHRNCHATSLISAFTIRLGSPCFSYCSSRPLIALGENRISRQFRQASIASSP